jgi:hypothetical protein
MVQAKKRLSCQCVKKKVSANRTGREEEEEGEEEEGGGGEDPKEELETKPEPEQKGNPPQVDDPIFSDTNFLLLLFPLAPIFSSLQTPN